MSSSKRDDKKAADERAERLKKSSDAYRKKIMREQLQRQRDRKDSKALNKELKKSGAVPLSSTKPKKH